MSQSKRAQNPIKATEVTLAVLDGLKELNGAGVTELADHLGMSKSRVHNYLSTLRQEEYVVKDGTTYDVGLRFVGLGTYARHRKEIYQVARAELESLAEETGDLVNLLVEEHGRGVYLYREQGENAVKVDSYTGHRVHLHNTALGKSILAELPEERVDEIVDHHGLPRTTEKSITDREALAGELAEVRERGVAFDDEERLPGLRCVACAVTDNDGEVQGAISVSGPVNRLSGDRIERELADLVRGISGELRVNLSYR